jgi:hypothetical protein
VRVPDVEEAVKLVTDPANVSRMGVTGPQQQFAVSQKRVLRALRNEGAGKAEARELALEALERVGGGAEIRGSRGARPAGRGGEAEVESWWVPADAVRHDPGP